MSKKYFRVILVTSIIAVCAVCIFGIFICMKNIDANDIDYVNVTLSRVYLNNLNDDIKFTVDNYNEVQNIIDFDRELFWYISEEGTNAVPWSVDLEFVLKDGRTILKHYEKTGNQKELFSQFLKYA